MKVFHLRRGLVAVVPDSLAYSVLTIWSASFGIAANVYKSAYPAKVFYCNRYLIRLANIYHFYLLKENLYLKNTYIRVLKLFTLAVVVNIIVHKLYVRLLIRFPKNSVFIFKRPYNGSGGSYYSQSITVRVFAIC